MFGHEMLPKLHGVFFSFWTTALCWRNCFVKLAKFYFSQLKPVFYIQMHFYFTSTSITHANLSLSKTYSASITLPKLAALKSKSSAQKRELISGKLDQRLIPPRKPGHVSLLFFFCFHVSAHVHKLFQVVCRWWPHRPVDNLIPVAAAGIRAGLSTFALRR